MGEKLRRGTSSLFPLQELVESVDQRRQTKTTSSRREGKSVGLHAGIRSDRGSSGAACSALATVCALDVKLEVTQAPHFYKQGHTGGEGHDTLFDRVIMIRLYKARKKHFLKLFMIFDSNPAPKPLKFVSRVPPGHGPPALKDGDACFLRGPEAGDPHITAPLCGNTCRA